MRHYNTDVVVVGAGPVGLFAVFQAGMLKMQCHVIDSLEVIGGQCAALYPDKPIYDIPAYSKISGAQLIVELAKQAEPFAPVYHLNQEVLEVIKNSDGTFNVVTSKSTVITTKVVIVAAGAGAFGPNKPPLDNLEYYEGISVFYAVVDPKKFAGKKVVIAGGGDSAVDWAIVLADIAQSVSVVHRRGKFRCSPESTDKLCRLAEAGKINIEVPYQLHSLNGQDGVLETISLIDLDNKIKKVPADILLPLFGLAMELGPILNWGLGLSKKHVAVEAATMRTNIAGIYAIGDISTYSGKLKLILTGFAEAAIACHDAYNVVYPDTPLHFEYSTTKGVEINN